MARFGDAVGWTLIDDYNFVFTYDISKQTYFHAFNDGEPPTVGYTIIVNRGNQLPIVHSIAVRLDGQREYI